MIKKVVMYGAKCDQCGIEAEFGDFTCYGDKDSVRTDLHAQGWYIDENDNCTCDECVTKNLLS